MQYFPCNVKWNAIFHVFVFSLCDIIFYSSFICDEGPLSIPAPQSWMRARVANSVELVSSVVFLSVSSGPKNQMEHNLFLCDQFTTCRFIHLIIYTKRVFHDKDDTKFTLFYKVKYPLKVTFPSTECSPTLLI